MYHYTQRDAAESILGSNKFRFGNIEERFSEDEIVTFCETHQLRGYLERDADDAPRYKSLLMPNTFYTSFTESSLTTDEEEYRSDIACFGFHLHRRRPPQANQF